MGEPILSKVINTRTLTEVEVQMVVALWERHFFDINDSTYKISDLHKYYAAQNAINDILDTLPKQDSATLKCVLMDDLVGEIHNAPHLDSKTSWMLADCILHKVVSADGVVVVEDTTRHIHPEGWKPEDQHDGSS